MENTERFTGKAEVYARSRPGYPAALYDWLSEEFGLGKGSAAADIGSGTGIFLRPLLERGCRVFAVEPNGDMRRQAERALSGRPGFVSVAGTAEHTGLPDGAVDFVTAAQAFHWFDPEGFRRECARILRPGGRVALVWNARRDEPGGIPLPEWAAVFRRYCPNYGANCPTEDRVGQFFGGRCEARQFPNGQSYDRRGFLERSLSASYSLKKGDAEYEDYLRALGEVFDRNARGGRLEVPYTACAYVGRVTGE